MKKVKEQLKPFRIPIFLLLGLGIVYILFNVVVPKVKSIQINKSPIVGLKVTNNQVYNLETGIKEQDFLVEAKHENGKFAPLATEKFEVSPKQVASYGKTTKVTVKLKDNPEIKAITTVKNERKEIVSFDIGKPNRKDVKAVLYSNGELAFEGKGDVLQYDKNSFPWKENLDVVIRSVTFEDEVAPLSMDFWFSDMTEIEYIDKLPVSVESISGMCSGCEMLKKAPEWSKCKNLLDISYAFEGCIALEEIPALTKSIRTAAGMCTDCLSLEITPDMRSATDLENAESMFYNCQALITADTMPPHVENIDSMYENCINLKEAPELPESVTSMKNIFANNMSLRTGARIPSNVYAIEGAYSYCTKLKGEIVIDANPESYQSFLSDACTATKVNLTGKSSLLNEIALTNKLNNVTVNGAAPAQPRR